MPLVRIIVMELDMLIIILYDTHGGLMING